MDDRTAEILGRYILRRELEDLSLQQKLLCTIAAWTLNIFPSPTDLLDNIVKIQNLMKYGEIHEVSLAHSHLCTKILQTSPHLPRTLWNQIMNKISIRDQTGPKMPANALEWSKVTKFIRIALLSGWQPQNIALKSVADTLMPDRKNINVPESLKNHGTQGLDKQLQALGFHQ
jgi:hypothetical protein